jgi:hypothetical protein
MFGDTSGWSVKRPDKQIILGGCSALRSIRESDAYPRQRAVAKVDGALGACV